MIVKDEDFNVVLTGEKGPIHRIASFIVAGIHKMKNSTENIQFLSIAPI